MGIYTPPAPQIPVLGQNLGATELLDKHCSSEVGKRLLLRGHSMLQEKELTYNKKKQPTICLVSPLALPALSNKRTLRLITS